MAQHARPNVIGHMLDCLAQLMPCSSVVVTTFNNLAVTKLCLASVFANTDAPDYEVVVADNASGYYISLAPLVAGGKLMVGTSGGEFGVRGFVAALDLDTELMPQDPRI